MEHDVTSRATVYYLCTSLSGMGSVLYKSDSQARVPSLQHNRALYQALEAIFTYPISAEQPALKGMQFADSCHV